MKSMLMEKDRENYMKLKLVVLGTLWIAVCIVAFFWFGMTYIHDEATAWIYYGLVWILAGILSGTPFVIYACMDDE